MFECPQLFHNRPISLSKFKLQKDKLFTEIIFLNAV